jgi:hypothetical protein
MADKVSCSWREETITATTGDPVVAVTVRVTGVR